jgi:DNA mismatch endonuclease (patch repair protein)
LKVPATNAEYWTRKFERNVDRDQLARKALKNANWAVLTLWECELANEATTRRTLRNFLHKQVHVRPKNR